MKVMVIYGGSPMEFDIAQKTATFVVHKLKKLNHEISIFSLKDIKKWINQIDKFNIVYLVTYGCPGEDGTIQGVLDLFDIPYTGSGVLASALCKDKLVFKQFISGLGVRTPSYYSLSAKDYLKNPQLLNSELSRIAFPIILKPRIQGGSSIGICKITDKSGYSNAVREVAKFDNEILVEKYIQGTDYIIGAICDVNNIRLLPIARALKNKDENFKTRYCSNEPLFTNIHNLPKATVEEMERMTNVVLKNIKIRGMCYLDFRLDKNDVPYLIELGTTYGMLPNSVIPVSAQKIGLEIEDLISISIEIAIKNNLIREKNIHK